MIELERGSGGREEDWQQMAVITVTVNTLLAKVTEVASPWTMGSGKDGPGPQEDGASVMKLADIKPGEDYVYVPRGRQGSYQRG